MPECNYYQPGESIDYTPLAAVAAGQVLQLPDGRAGWAENAIAAGVKGALRVKGVVDVLKTASMVFLPGSKAFWDHSSNAAHLLHGNDKDFFIGTVMEDAASAATTVRVNLNVEPVYTVGFDSPWVGVNVQTAGFPSFAQSGKDGVNLRFSPTAEVQKVDALTLRGFSPHEGAIVHNLICVNDIGDDAALDFNAGLANATHASSGDSITESLFIHMDGASLDILAESDDGTTEVAATDTTVDAVAGTPFLVQWDLRNLEDIQLYINGVNRLPASVFKLNAAVGPLKMLAHLEKTSNDTPGNFTVAGGVTLHEPLNS